MAARRAWQPYPVQASATQPRPSGTRPGHPFNLGLCNAGLVLVARGIVVSPGSVRG
jgi:hypothetical protein